MKIVFRLFLTTFALFCTQCTRQENAPLTPKIDFDKASIELMKDLAPQIVGQWKLRAVHFKYQPYNNNQIRLGITKDTTFFDLATLTIEPAAVPRSAPRDLRRGEYDGTITYGKKTYPIQFDLMANPEWLVKKTGSQAFFLLQYHFPSGTSHPVEPEEAFLEAIGLMTDNFALEVRPDQPKLMLWKGLNQGVREIELMKN